MVKCEKCGQDFIKEKQLEYIKKKLGDDIFEFLCPKCKKTAVTEKLKDIYKDIPPNR